MSVSVIRHFSPQEGFGGLRFAYPPYVRSCHDPDALSQLMDWYASQCNGDWEHQYGIHLDLLDNPGWSLKIDLADTEYQDRLLDHTVRNIESAASWSDSFQMNPCRR